MAVTVTYEWPVAGTTAPTTTQMSKRNIVNANVIKSADADTTVTITHNMQLTVAQLAQGFPKITITPLLVNFYLSTPFVSAVATNTITITTVTTGSSGVAGAQMRVTVERLQARNK